jgi:hypothetical protein
MSEYCDCCGEIVTYYDEDMHVKIKHKHHFHQTINGRTWTICVTCVWMRMHVIGRMKKPWFYKENSWNAGWYPMSLDELIFMHVYAESSTDN